MNKLKDIVSEMGRQAERLLKWFVKIGPAIICVINPFVAVMLFKKGFNDWYMITIALFLITYILKVIKRVSYTYDGVPVYKRRFTKKDDLGNVYFSTPDTYEMLDYLAEVEDHLESMGFYIQKK